MATLVTATWANWTVLATGISLVGLACSPSPVPPGQTGGTSGVGGTPLPGTGGIGAVGGAPTTGGTGGGTGGGSGGIGPSTGGSNTGGDVSTGGAGPSTGGGSNGGGIDNYNPDFKEFVGEDCELPDSALLSPTSHALPDPFLMSDGTTRMSSMSEWACQRAWLKKNIESHVYGEKHGKPASVTGTVSSSSISVQMDGATYSVSIDLPPNANGPVPGMFQAEGSGLPTSFLHAEGIAAMSYQHAAAESAYNAVNGSAGSEPIKWAWAVSRAIDVLVDQAAAGQNDIIDPKALGTTGCSYAGKSAFVVGAFDERIALGIPVESGTGGLGSYRVVGDMDLGPNGGENPEQVSEACGQGWFTGTVCNGNVDSVPADAHFMVAMYAPRGFTTLDNNRIGHLGPVAQYTSTALGAEVFKALGVESHVGYHGGNDDDPHGHCSFNASQMETAQKAVRGFLTKTEPPGNFMEPKLKNSSDQAVNWVMADYAEWTAPTLAP